LSLMIRAHTRHSDIFALYGMVMILMCS